MMGMPVSELMARMDHKELLHHLHDLEQDLPIKEYLNLLFARQNKLILDCSDVKDDHKRKFRLEDFMLKFKDKNRTRINVNEIARRNKYRKLL